MVERASLATHLAVPALVVLLSVTGCVRAKPARTAFRPVAASESTSASSTSSVQEPVSTPAATDGGPQETPANEPAAPTLTASLVVAPTQAAIADKTSAPSATLLPGENPTYVVHTGDTLVSIAERFDVTIEAITSANGLASADTLRIGQTLIIPMGEQPVTRVTPETVEYVVKPGDTLSQIAREYQTTPKAILSQNISLASAETLAVGTVLRITKGNVAPAQLHVVQRGESMAGIARARGVSLRDLVQANASVDPNNLAVGQVLVIPY
ncbi:MAG: LysM peptidoglycan-binding domain-containing protein [Anaerolineae bacterium]